MVTPKSTPSLKISCKSVQPFSRNVADKEINKQTNKQTNKQRNRSITIPRPPTGGGVNIGFSESKTHSPETLPVTLFLVAPTHPVFFSIFTGSPRSNTLNSNLPRWLTFPLSLLISALLSSHSYTFSAFLTQSDALESVQKRAVRIIYPECSSDYWFYLATAGIDTLKERREALSERFFKKQVLPSGSLLHYLLPDRRDNDTISKLRNPKPFLIRACTHNSFVARSYLMLWTISYKIRIIHVLSSLSLSPSLPMFWQTDNP